MLQMDSASALPITGMDMSAPEQCKRTLTPNSSAACVKVLAVQASDCSVIRTQWCLDRHFV